MKMLRRLFNLKPKVEAKTLREVREWYDQYARGDRHFIISIVELENLEEEHRKLLEEKEK